MSKHTNPECFGLQILLGDEPLGSSLKVVPVHRNSTKVVAAITRLLTQRSRTAAHENTSKYVEGDTSSVAFLIVPNGQR